MSEDELDDPDERVGLYELDNFENLLSSMSLAILKNLLSSMKLKILLNKKAWISVTTVAVPTFRFSYAIA